MSSFVPIVRSPHLLTIAGNYWPRNLDLARFPVSARYFETEPGVEVLVHSQEPEGERRGDLVLVHGLEGSSASGYLQSAAQAALCEGLAAHRFNMRSCGGTEATSGRVLYHSGQTCDLLSVIRQLRSEGRWPIFLAGYSLGANAVLKLAGELGDRAIGLIEGIFAVSTPIDLAACAENLNLRSNYLYSRRFLARLKERIRRKEALAPGLFDLSLLPKVHTIYEFDDHFTAVCFDFGSADRYYATQSARNFLAGVRIPALLVQAKDDPLIPFRVYDHPAFRSNPCLTLEAVEHGGHLGFLSRRTPRFWLDERMIEWLREIRNRTTSQFVSSEGES